MTHLFNFDKIYEYYPSNNNTEIYIHIRTTHSSTVILFTNFKILFGIQI